MPDKEAMYNGVSNRETKILKTWLYNCEWLRTEAKRRIASANNETSINDILQEFICELSGAVGFSNMFMEIGDIGRVNWEELAEAVV